MGRRTLFTQKELEILFKHPPLGFIVIGITLLILGCFALYYDTGIGSIIVFISIICIGVGIVLFIINDNSKKGESNGEGANMSNDHRRELPPTYRIQSVSFNRTTKACKVTFVESKRYRTIERYVTQNYIKYPILSPWKEKTKIITKTVKLTNAALEHLNMHEDYLIRQFASDIISEIGDSDFFPSWYLKRRARKQYEANVEKRKQELSRLRGLVIDCQTRISQLAPRTELKKAEIEKKINALEKKKDNLIKSLERANTMKPSVLLNIITLGIYCYLRSEMRKAKITKAINTAESNIAFYHGIIDKLEAELSAKRNQLTELQRQAEEFRVSSERDNEAEHEQMLSVISKIKPLLTTVTDDEKFVLLKHLVGAEYKKIVGCYVIKNNENGKCYVGQSKDVIKRIKQHFKGTEPHNIIFAEDYYSSKFQDKTALFSVLIIPTSVADLDPKERELIEKYDALQTGYNSTAGNK